MGLIASSLSCGGTPARRRSLIGGLLRVASARRTTPPVCQRAVEQRGEADESRDGDLGHTDTVASARGSVHHPRRQPAEGAVGDLAEEVLAVGARLATLDAHKLAVQGVPAVVDGQVDRSMSIM